MKLSELLSKQRLTKRARLLKTIKLSNGKSISSGKISDLLLDLGDGRYHFEVGDVATTVLKNEICFVK